MTNFSAKILNNAVSSLTAQQAVIANTSNNIANVNTPGYTRRVVNLETRLSRGDSGLVNIGNGVQIGQINQIVDNYLERVLRDARGDQAGANVENSFLRRLESLFSLRPESQTIGNGLTAFFAAASDLTTNPSSISLRQNFVERANDLVQTISTTFNTLAALQTEADDRIGTEIAGVNAITSQIAVLNGNITAREATGQTAADERDRRTQLMAQLSDKIGYSAVEASDGSVTINLSNGFPLVVGTTSRELAVTKDPSFAGGSVPPSLSGGALNYIVYDYDSSSSGASHINLTQIVGAGAGALGGLVRTRGYNDPANTSAFSADGSIVEVASRVEAITRALLTDFNTSYLGPDRGGTPGVHDPSSGDLDGNQPTDDDDNPVVYALFTFDYDGSGSRDTDGNGLPDDLSDPDLGIDNFSSRLALAFSDPRKVAAARDAGSGPPAAPEFASGDASNMIALADLQDTQLTLSTGSFNLTSTLNDGYAVTVNHVGNLRTRADVGFQVASDSLQIAQNRRDEISGVSLDEEFTGLIKYQKAYQASARMIKIADQLLEQIVNLI